ncbi:MAG TPA: hypothetical protein P5160_02570 [Candidatus Omnitrophota bacterium]|nr:hypothetical protein [Candidatus Omnitrophota bacterium]
MTTKQSVYQERKERILGIVVNEYIRTVTPVSSSYIAQRYLLDVSPATIRNILAELEEEGYLTHPHTSAGRLPTQEGYRFYVDNIMNEISLLEEQKQVIKREYEEETRNLERLLEKTTQVISDLTHYTSIITVDGSNDRVFCSGRRFVVEYPDYQNIEKIRNILSVLERKEQLIQLINCELQKRVQVFIGHELACKNMDDCAVAISSYALHDGQTGRIAVLGPARMDYEKVVSTLEYLSRLMHEL